LETSSSVKIPNKSESSVDKKEYVCWTMCHTLFLVLYI
jgi:hypothetical protein